MTDGAPYPASEALEATVNELNCASKLFKLLVAVHPQAVWEL